MNEQNYIERYWRDATPADAIKEPPMVARFRDKDEGSWHFDVLSGWNRRSLAKWLCGCLSWRFCQVYDAPDPGEGWRLVDPDSDSYNQDGIEFWYPAFKLWFSRRSFGRDKQPFEMDNATYYRIRIEPPNPEPKYVPFTWEDREQLRGRWVCCVDAPQNEWPITSLYIDGGGELRANGVPAGRLASGFIFLDTGEPVGKKVVQ